MKINSTVPKFLYLLWVATILSSCHQTNTPSLNLKPAAYFNYKITGCAKTEISKNKLSETNNTTTPDFLNVVAQEDSLVFKQSVSHFCCRKVKLGSSQTDSTIIITTYWYGKICKCHCSSQLYAVVNKIPAGKYNVYIINVETDLTDEQKQLPKDTIWRNTISIK